MRRGQPRVRTATTDYVAPRDDDDREAPTLLGWTVVWLDALVLRCAA